MCTAPSYLCDCLKLCTPSHTLRSASDTLSLQILHNGLSTVVSHAFSISGPSTWKDFPLPLQQEPSLDSFKYNLKTFLFSKIIRPTYSPSHAASTLMCAGACVSTWVWVWALNGPVGQDLSCRVTLKL